jgi:hypothetical protein
LRGNAYPTSLVCRGRRHGAYQIDTWPDPGIVEEAPLR